MGVLGSSIGGRVLAALAIGLFVVGAGAAVGIGTTQHPTRAGVDGAPSPLAGSVPTGGAKGPTTTSPTTAGPAGSTSGAGATTSTTTRSAPVPVAQTPSGRAGGGSSTAAAPPPAAGPGGSAGAPPSAAGSSSAATPSGTYTYATSGQSNITFFGSSQYPSTTTIVVSRQGCGVSARWNADPGSNTTVYECPVAGGVHVVSESSTIQTHGYSNTMSFTCGANSFVPTSGSPGQTWEWDCTSSNGETAHQVVKLDGPQPVDVAGRPVAAEHVTVHSTLSGPDQGTATTDYWLTTNAVPVKEVGSANASQGGFSYTSNYTLQLDSLTPTA
jgi:hypothetical protein